MSTTRSLLTLAGQECIHTFYHRIVLLKSRASPIIIHPLPLPVKKANARGEFKMSSDDEYEETGADWAVPATPATSLFGDFTGPVDEYVCAHNNA